MAISASPKLTPLTPAGTAGVVKVAVAQVEDAANHGLDVQ